MRKIVLAVVFSLMAIVMQAQDLTIKLWDNTTAPHSNSLQGKEKDEGGVRYSNTTEAVLYIYEADEEKATGQSIVICPGGGYWLVAIGHEGHDFGRWFAENGITAAVLMYRMPNHRPEVPLEDAAEALRYMKEEYAPAHTIRSVGIMGFSAGGHLAGSASTIADDKDKPNFSILFYPVLTAGDFNTHRGSFRNLLGKHHTAAEADEWAMDKIASEQTPPTILLLSDDDTTVPAAGSALYYAALRYHGVKASMHIFPTGGHGWGNYDKFAYQKEWQHLLLRWLSDLK